MGLFTANLFALAAMMTSYWAVAGSFLTNIVDKFNFKSEDDVKTRLFCFGLCGYSSVYFGV